jgi:hypothetical protein
MVGLLDIADLTREVEVRGTKISVTGISTKGVASLLDKFPDLRKIVAQRSDEVSAESLVAQVPDAVAAVIAAGCGYPGNEEAMDKAAMLSVGEQAEIIDAIFQITFPQGIAPFMEKLTRFAAAVSPTPETTAKTPVAGSGSIPGTRLPGHSKK